MRVIVVRIVRFSFALLTVGPAIAAQEPAPPVPDRRWLELTAGPHAVGYRVLYELDHTRVWTPGADADAPRPVRVSVWYPATTDRSARRMSVGDYLARTAPDPLSARLEHALVDRRLAFVRRLLADSTVQPRRTLRDVLARQTAAVRDAGPAPGRFPVVLYAAGWDNIPPDNSILCEYLASHGYVVATVPQLIARADAPIRPHTPAQVEDDARDLEVAYGALRRLGAVADRSTIAAMGFSGGGWVALSVAARNPRVRALVGLDPVLGFTETAPLTVRLAGFEPTALTAPLLILQAGDSAERAEQGDEVLDSLRFADRYQGHVGRTTHMEFTDAAVTVGAAWPGEGARAAAAYGAYAAIARTVRAFLDGTLRGAQARLDSVARGATGLPGAGAITMRVRRAAASLALSPQDWARFEGTYLLTRTDGAQLPAHVYDVGGELAMRVGDDDPRPIRLRYLGGQTFELLMSPVARLVFTVEGGRATKVTVHQRGQTFDMPRVR